MPSGLPVFFFFSSRRRHTRLTCDWSSDVCSSDLGGKFRMSFKNFTTGKAHSFGGEYLELVPHEFIRYTDQFDDPDLPGIIHVTVSLKPVSVRSEERRVGKECRCRWGVDQYK